MPASFNRAWSEREGARKGRRVLCPEFARSERDTRECLVRLDDHEASERAWWIGALDAFGRELATSPACDARRSWRSAGEARLGFAFHTESFDREQAAAVGSGLHVENLYADRGRIEHVKVVASEHHAGDDGCRHQKSDVRKKAAAKSLYAADASPSGRVLFTDSLALR